MNLFRAFALTSAVALSAISSASMYTFNDIMCGIFENPLNLSPAVGHAVGTYDDSTNSMELQIGASGFWGFVISGSMHQAPAEDENGPLQFDFDHSYNGGNTYFMQPTHFSLTDDQEAALFTHLVYVNIFTTAVPTGEIRAFIKPVAVPEPGPIVALLVGLGAILRRRSASHG